MEIKEIDDKITMRYRKTKEKATQIRFACYNKKFNHVRFSKLHSQHAVPNGQAP